MSAWRDYENEIHAMLIAKAEPGATIEFDAHKPGRLSGTTRQIDVWLEGELAGGVLPGPVSLAVDCKCWSSTVNVPDVERFFGTLDDVGADIGLLVTTTGFSRAAQQRAANARGLQLEVVTFEQLDSWSPAVEWCLVCNDPESDSMPGMFYAEPLGQAGSEARITVGSCDRCQAVHLRCSCGVLTGVAEGEEGQTLACDGCGRAFVVDPVEYDRDHIPITEAARDRVRLVGAPEI